MTMYRGNEDQELHPDDYFLAHVGGHDTEDESFDLMSDPRQTQTTIGLFLKKKKNAGIRNGFEDTAEFQKRPDPNQRDSHLEKLLDENKGFWTDKPTLVAPLVNQLKNLYSVDLPKKDPKRSGGIFYRPEYFELDHLKKLAQAGLIYDDEETVDSDEEVTPDDACISPSKEKSEICDSCKPKGENVKTIDEVPKTATQQVLPFKRIPTGCQCNYYWEHDKKLDVWDCPYQDEVDMIRKHEMNKSLKPFKSELLNENYKKNRPVIFKPSAFTESKRTFPDLMLSTL